MSSVERCILTPEGFGQMLHALRGDGYTLLGPTVRDGAIVCAEIDGIDDLPAGWTTTHAPGASRLERRGDGALFGYAVGPQSFKQAFFAPRLRLWQAQRNGTAFTVTADEPAPRPLALVGARACDLHAIAIQDRVFLEGHPDPDYAARRADVFVVGLHCGQAGGTCFCVSMGTGPRVTTPVDVVLTELLDGEHRFLAEAGSPRGQALLGRVPGRVATDDDGAAADRVVERTAAAMGRRLDATRARAVLMERLEHPRWSDVATRCLSCANCTMVCPTCFCSTVEDVTDLRGDHAERWRTWDSCFTLDHSYLHGGSVHASTRSRYRQWLTHKLATWHEQFGTSGCVGCGRCVTWCPVGIDLTEEVAALLIAEEAPHGHP